MKEIRIYSENLDGYTISIEISDASDYIYFIVDQKRIFAGNLGNMHLLIDLLEKAVRNKENFKMEDIL